VADRRLLYASVLLRALSIGLVGVLLSFHLERKGFDDAQVGVAVSLGLVGMAVATLAVGLWADRAGRRRSLAALALLSAAGVGAVALAGEAGLLWTAALLGMLNGAGRDRGALPALEQSVLASTATSTARTRAFAVYNLLDDGGLALGALLVWVGRRALGETSPPRVLQDAGMAVAAGLMVVAAGAYARLSARSEAGPARERIALSPTTRKRVARISALFFLDGFGGGLLAATFLATFFRERFGASAATVALLFAGARVLNAASHLGAAWLATRIGLVNTMVFTHAPSSVLLFTVTIAPSFEVAALLFLLREGLVEMDVPTRQSYVMAIVEPRERTAVSAVTNLVRIVSWAAAAAVAGALMQGPSIGVPFAIAAVLKLVYDALLYVAFRRVRPPAE
jgi:MFS family permease